MDEEKQLNFSYKSILFCNSIMNRRGPSKGTRTYNAIIKQAGSNKGNISTSEYSHCAYLQSKEKLCANLIGMVDTGINKQTKGKVAASSNQKAPFSITGSDPAKTALIPVFEYLSITFTKPLNKLGVPVQLCEPTTGSSVWTELHILVSTKSMCTTVKNVTQKIEV